MNMNTYATDTKHTVLPLTNGPFPMVTDFGMDRYVFFLTSISVEEEGVRSICPISKKTEMASC